mgnify:FL=1
MGTTVSQFICYQSGIARIEFLLDKNNPGIVPAAGFYQFFQMGGRGFFSSFFNADLLQSIVPGKITECRMIDEESGVGIL